MKSKPNVVETEYRNKSSKRHWSALCVCGRMEATAAATKFFFYLDRTVLLFDAGPRPATHIFCSYI